MTYVGLVVHLMVKYKKVGGGDRDIGLVIRRETFGQKCSQNALLLLQTCHYMQFLIICSKESPIFKFEENLER